MADPLTLLAERLSPVFADLAGAPADPVVRPSDHADAQVNGALPLAKALGRNPREVAQHVADAIVALVQCQDEQVAKAGG